MTRHRRLLAASDWLRIRWIRLTYCSHHGHHSNGGWYCLNCAAITADQPTQLRSLGRARWVGLLVVGSQFAAVLTLTRSGHILSAAAVTVGAAIAVACTVQLFALYRAAVIRTYAAPPDLPEESADDRR